MLDLAYPSLTEERKNAYVVGGFSDRSDNGYLWHYWLPWLALLDRDHLRLGQLDQVLQAGHPFVFPLEFRWEIIKWMKKFAKGRPADFLNPHIPAAVLNASRAGRAIILLFFAHEGRSMSLQARETQSAYDLILKFVRDSSLPPAAVWFVNGNLKGRIEYRAWKRHRFGSENAPDPFQVRFVELFSHLAQATWREEDRGFEAAVEWKAEENADHTLTHKYTRVALRLKETAGATLNVPAASNVPAATHVPSKLFLCMNRAVREHRRILVCHLLRRGFLERSLVSFQDDGRDQVRFNDDEMNSAWQELKRRQPLVIDRDLPLDLETYYRTNDAAVKPGEAWPYIQSCFSIVTETHFVNDVAFVSEKLWKPIRYGHPFLVAGTPGTLAYLRQLGFQTFAPAIDERYDAIEDDGERMQALFDAIDALGTLDAKGYANLLELVHPVVLHNMNHLRKLKTPFSVFLEEIDKELNGI